MDTYAAPSNCAKPLHTGGRHLDQIRTDKDLDPFRNHPEFKKILSEIEKLPALAPPPRAVRQ